MNELVKRCSKFMKIQLDGFFQKWSKAVDTRANMGGKADWLGALCWGISLLMRHPRLTS